MAVFRGLFVRKDSTRGTQPAEARKALAGLLVPSSALGARQGILAAPGNPLQVTGTAGWQYSANAGHVASSRSDVDGAVLFGNDGTALTPAVSAAPGSGSRWDLIYLRHQDIGQGGGETSDATLGVVSGVASGSPVRPTVPAGAVVVAEALVAAGATSTSHANVTITNLLPYTVARGAPVPVRTQPERDALTPFDGLLADRLDLDILERHNGTEWRSLTGADSGETSVPVFAVGSGSATLLAATTLTNPFSGPCIVEAELVGEAAVGANSSARFVLTVVTTGRAGWARNFSASQLNFAPNVKARHKTTSGQVVTVAVTADNVGAGGISGAAGDLRVQWLIRPAR